MSEIRFGFVEEVFEKENAAIVRWESPGYNSPKLRIMQRPGKIRAENASLEFFGERKEHTHEITSKEWLPEKGDFVICAIVSISGGGYILGKVER